MDYVIERLTAQNIHHLVRLYRKTFHQSIPLSVLTKKYNTRTFGPRFIGFIAFTQEEIAAAYYGVIPCFFQRDGRTVLAAQSADTMTHPDHRKKGLFQLLAQKTYDLARAESIQFVFGFPNQDSFPGFVKLGWQFTRDKLQVFTMKAGNFSYASLVKRSRLLFSLYINLLHGVFGKQHPSESFFETKLQDGVKHDNSFCDYKTYNPTFMLSVNEVKIWVKADGRLKVGALQGLNKQNVSNVLSRLGSMASRLGCSDVIFMTSKNSPLYILLKESLTPKEAFPIGFISLNNELLSFDNFIFDYCDVDIF